MAPVVGDTNLLLHNCCMISPATLMPIPVHRMASRRGSREIRKTSICSKFPASSSAGVRSITPTNSEQQDKTSNRTERTMVDRYALIVSSPFFLRLAIANRCVKRMRSGDWTYRASHTAHRKCIIAHEVSHVQPRKKHKQLSRKNVFFLAILQIVSMSKLRLSSQPAHASQTDSQSGEGCAA